MSEPLPEHPGVGISAPYDPCVDPPGLGVRTVGSDVTSGELLDVLRVTADLGDPSLVEIGVRARAARFAPVSLAGLSPIARVSRADDGRLEVWSRKADGFRLSAVLEWTEARGLQTPLDVAITVGDRLLAALASLQQADRGTGASGHGAIAVDQVVLAEDGTLTLTDYAFGTVLSGLQLTRDRLWRRFRIAMPPAAGLARFDHRVDVTQAAVVIVALLLGRVPRTDEYPRDVAFLVAEAARRGGASAGHDERDAQERLHAWLRAATELDPRNAFRSAGDARAALAGVFGARPRGPAAVHAWLRAARGLPPVDVRPAAVTPETPARPVPAPEPSVFERLSRWLGGRNS